MVVDPPASFEAELGALKGVDIVRDPKKASEIGFSLAFATTQEQVDKLAPAIAQKAERRRDYLVRVPKGKLEEV